MNHYRFQTIFSRAVTKTLKKLPLFFYVSSFGFWTYYLLTIQFPSLSQLSSLLPLNV